MNFIKQKVVRFSHCDPAGIVFYPRYAELCNEMVEDWFADGLGFPLHRFQQELRLTIPAVRLECEFVSTSTYGDVLDFTLAVRALGRSSLSLELAARCEGKERVRFALKLVLVSLDTMRAVPINDSWRERFGRFQGGDAGADPVPVASP
ncbi:MAG TPA: thioesterase family protein [Rubrivivax sp.]|nr:thioesterase family protein [Rubrivivax sp.]